MVADSIYFDSRLKDRDAGCWMLDARRSNEMAGGVLFKSFSKFLMKAGWITLRQTRYYNDCKNLTLAWF